LSHASTSSDAIGKRAARELAAAGTVDRVLDVYALMRHTHQRLEWICRRPGLVRRTLGYRCNEVVFASQRLPAVFDGVTIVHLSDLHADGIRDRGESLSELLRSIRCDLCVITGDFQDPDRCDPERAAAVSGRITRAVRPSIGCIAVLGNHDSAAIIPLLEREGITVLVNDARGFERRDTAIWIVGVDDDHYFHAADLDAATAEVPEAEFQILLSHSPTRTIVEKAAAHGIDYFLCGHTHGGQVCLPRGRPLVSNCAATPDLLKGSWRFRNLHGYTSPGIGCSTLPTRLFCPPEVIVHRLRTASR